MLAHHWLVENPWILRFLGEVTVNSHPVHDSPLFNLLLADNSHIVLRGTGHNTVIATGTFIQIHHQSPVITVELCLGIKGLVMGFSFQVKVISRIWICLKLFQACLPNDGSSLHGVVGLGPCNGITPIGLLKANTMKGI